MQFVTSREKVRATKDQATIEKLSINLRSHHKPSLINLQELNTLILQLVLVNGYRGSLFSFFIMKSMNNESASFGQKSPLYRAFLRKYIRAEGQLCRGSIQDVLTFIIKEF